MSHGPGRGAGAPLADWRDPHLPSNRGRKITKEEREERARLCLEAVQAINEREAQHYIDKDLGPWHLRNASAASVAWYIGVAPAQQLGSGAKRGSWSGSMVPALRVAPTLRALAKRGELVDSYDSHGEDYRYRYHLPGEDVHTIYRRLRDAEPDDGDDVKDCGGDPVAES